jgi:hypothetical protein
VTPDLLFEESTHTYKVNGKVVPSVTQVIRAAGMMPWLDQVPPDTLRAACERGKRVHAVIEQINRGNRNWINGEHFGWLADHDSVGYINSYLGWLDDTGFRVERKSIERKFFNRIWGYAGCEDFEGVDRKGCEWLVDIKSGGFEPAARLQTAAYLEERKLGRLVLRPQRDGGLAKAHPLPKNEILRDWQGFRTCLSLSYLKELYGIHPRRAA